MSSCSRNFLAFHSGETKLY